MFLVHITIYGTCTSYRHNYLVMCTIYALYLHMYTLATNGAKCYITISLNRRSVILPLLRNSIRVSPVYLSFPDKCKKQLTNCTCNLHCQNIMVEHFSAQLEMVFAMETSKRLYLENRLLRLPYHPRNCLPG